MTGQMRKKWARAAVCAAALAAPLAVSGCASQAGVTTGTAGAPATTGSATSTVTTGAQATSSTSAKASSSSPASPSSPTSSAPAPLNGTGGTSLIVADGSSTVLINGTSVDFGTAVHDPAFSPDGKHIAFIDARGDLMVANADGTGRTEVAKNPGGQQWSHPTWQVTGADQYRPARDNIFFASSAGGTTLWQVVATAHDGKPEQLSLGGMAGENMDPMPQTANLWPSAAGKFGAAVYEHDNGSASDIYVRDDYLRQQGGLSIKDAAQPGYVLVGGSSSGEPDPEVVFVRSVNGHRHVFISSLQTSTGGDMPKPKDLTPNATADCTMPAISADGKTIAYSTPAGVFTVSANGSGAPKQITSTPGFPAFRGGS